MKSKVTLKEMVGIKIIYAVLLVCYYWLCATQLEQDSVAIFTILFFAIQAGRVRKYGKEEKDELAIQCLHRIDAIGLKIMVAAAIVIAFASVITFIDGRMAGYALVGTIFALTVIRFTLFCVMSGKESNEKVR